MKMCADDGQQKTVSDCRHAMLDESAIDKLQVWTIAGIEILVGRNSGRLVHGHRFQITAVPT
jgi:hypothetical protein